MFTRKQLMVKYHNARSCAMQRKIEWQFTFDTWVEWWGDDIINRGPYKGQLVMARYGDQGPYHPDNVRKATSGENVIEAHKDKVIDNKTRAKMSIAKKGKTMTYKSGINPVCKPVQTPIGVFDSRDSAARAYSITHNGLYYRMKIKPTEYYYIKEQA